MANSNEYMRAYMANRRAKRRMQLIELFGGKCQHCNSENDLEFDHIDSQTKSFSLSGCGLDKSWKLILKEAEKCELLCHNCHKNKTVDCIETSGGRNIILIVNHGTMHMYGEYNCRCINCKYAKFLYRNNRIGYLDIVIAPENYSGKVGRPVNPV